MTGFSSPHVSVSTMAVMWVYDLFSPLSRTRWGVVLEPCMQGQHDMVRGRKMVHEMGLPGTQTCAGDRQPKCFSYTASLLLEMS